MLQNLGSTELMIIVLVLVVIFGSSKIANLGKNLGRTSKELKMAKKEYEAVMSGETNDKIPDQVRDDKTEEV